MYKGFDLQKYKDLYFLLKNSERSDFQQQDLLGKQLENELVSLSFPSDFNGIDGEIVVNGDTKDLAEAISQKIEIDLSYAAELLMKSADEVPGKVGDIYVAIELFYRERSYKLGIIEYILNNSYVDSSHPLREQFNLFVEAYLSTSQFKEVVHHLFEMLGPMNPEKGSEQCTDEMNIKMFGFIQKERQTICRIIHFILVHHKFDFDSFAKIANYLGAFTTVDTRFLHLFTTLLCSINRISTSAFPANEEINYALTLSNLLRENPWKMARAAACVTCFLHIFIKRIASENSNNISGLDFNFQKLTEEFMESLSCGPFNFISLNFFSPMEISNVLTQLPYGYENMICYNNPFEIVFPNTELKQLGVSSKIVLDRCEDEFKPVLLNCLDSFIRMFESSLHSIMESVLNMEDRNLILKPPADDIYPTRSDDEHHHQSMFDNLNRNGSTQAYNNDTTYFITEGYHNLIALVYNNQPSLSEQFIFNNNNSGSNYIKLVSNIRSFRLSISFKDSLISLSNGIKSSEHVFKYLTRSVRINGQHEGDSSQDHINLIGSTKNIKNYVDLLNDSYLIKIKSLPTKELQSMQINLKNEIRILIKLVSSLPLIRQLLTSIKGKIVIECFKVFLIQPHENWLKSLAMELFYSFTIPLGNERDTAAYHIWQMIDSMEMVSLDGRNAPFFCENIGNTFPLNKGGILNIGEAISFCKLINGLIRIDDGMSSKENYKINDTIPYNLGYDTRPAPGISHYVQLVLNVFTSVFEKKINDTNQIWEILSNCTDIMLTLLLEFEALVAYHSKCANFMDVFNFNMNGKTNIEFLLSHPAFEVICGLFYNRSLVTALVNALNFSQEHLRGTSRVYYPELYNCVANSLRILNIAFNLQPSIINSLNLEVAKYNVKKNIINPTTIKSIHDILLLLDFNQLFDTISSFIESNDQDISYNAIQLLNNIVIPNPKDNTVRSTQLISDSLWNYKYSDKIIEAYRNRVLYEVLPQPQSYEQRNNIDDNPYMWNNDYNKTTLEIFKPILRSLNDKTYKSGLFLLGYNDSSNIVNGIRTLIPKNDALLSALVKLLDEFLPTFQIFTNTKQAIRIDLNSEIFSAGYQILAKLCALEQTCLYAFTFLINSGFFSRHGPMISAFHTQPIYGDSSLSLDGSSFPISTELAINSNIAKGCLFKIIGRFVSLNGDSNEVMSAIENWFSKPINSKPYNNMDESPKMNILRAFYILFGEIQTRYNPYLLSEHDQAGLNKFIENVPQDAFKTSEGDSSEYIDSMVAHAVVLKFKDQCLNTAFGGDDEWFNRSKDLFKIYIQGNESKSKHELVQIEAIASWCDTIDLILSRQFNRIAYDQQSDMLIEILKHLVIKVQKVYNQEVVFKLISLIGSIIKKLFKEYKLSVKRQDIVNDLITNKYHELVQTLGDIWKQLILITSMNLNQESRAIIYSTIKDYLEFYQAFPNFLPKVPSDHKGDFFDLYLTIEQKTSLITQLIGDISQDSKFSLPALEFMGLLIKIFRLKQDTTFLDIILNQDWMFSFLVNSLISDIKGLLSHKDVDVVLEFYLAKVKILELIFPLIEVNQSRNNDTVLWLFDVIHPFENELANPENERERDLTYQYLTPLLTLLNVILSGCGENVNEVATKVSSKFQNHTRLFMSILKINDRTSLEKLTLLETTLELIFWFFRGGRGATYGQQVFLAYHMEIIYFYKRFCSNKNWTSNIKCIGTDKDSFNLYEESILKTEVKAGQIIAKVSDYLAAVYCLGADFAAQLASPMAMNHSLSIDATDINNRLISFREPISMIEMINIFSETFGTLLSVCDAIFNIDTMISNPEGITVDMIVNGLQLNSYETYNSKNLPHCRNRYISKLTGRKRLLSEYLNNLQSTLTSIIPLISTHVGDYLGRHSTFYVFEGKEKERKAYVENLKARLIMVSRISGFSDAFVDFIRKNTGNANLGFVQSAKEFDYYLKKLA
ncbi:hypothetical protein K502DRAFT_362283 [Neoconidiobolus thromboides FSU 785]|nr:hypothetical protein K502DRAFT_362283 [Neoconidiobolus thromboides FSU 785]